MLFDLNVSSPFCSANGLLRSTGKIGEKRNGTDPIKALTEQVSEVRRRLLLGLGRVRQAASLAERVLLSCATGQTGNEQDRKNEFCEHERLLVR